MSGLRWSGHLLLWIGFLAGALFAVCRTEIPDQPWSTIVWPAYGVALAVSLTGVVLLRTASRRGAGGTQQHASAVTRMSAILVRLHNVLLDWSQRRGDIGVFEFHAMIDDQLADDLAEFADLRESLIVTFGLQGYAGIMSEFALAERTINRIWSASADGYIDEVHRCLDRALGHLQRASDRMVMDRSENGSILDGEPNSNRSGAAG